MATSRKYFQSITHIPSYSQNFSIHFGKTEDTITDKLALTLNLSSFSFPIHLSSHTRVFFDSHAIIPID